MFETFYERDSELLAPCRLAKEDFLVKIERIYHLLVERNRQHMSRMRTFVKRVESAIKAGKKDEAQAAFKDATAIIAKTAQKGVIPARRAASSIPDPGGQTSRFS